MRAITIWQPWALLIAVGAKHFETRGWATSYRGPIAIHAGVKRPFDTMDGVNVAVIFAMGEAFGVAEKNVRVILDFLETLPRSAVIATAELVECWHIANDAGGAFINRGEPFGDIQIEEITGGELLFGDYSDGRYAWELANVKPLAAPAPARGRQRLWNWEEDNV